MSLRWKLTLWYVATVTLILSAFVGVDVYGQSRKLGAGAELSSQAAGDDIVREVLLEHGLLAVVTVFCVALVGHFVIGRALRPVQEMVSAAKAITAEDLSRRIRVGSHDEIGELGDTLNQMIARLERSFLHMNHFATVVAHELNTPLATLKGELELFRRRERTAEEYHALVPRLHTQIERLSGLIDNLLLLSRMESQGDALPFCDVPLDQLVLEAYEDYELPAAEAGLTLRVDVPEGAVVQGERALVKQLVANLLSNAIRYTDRGGSVAVSVALTPEGTRLRVLDSGRGISADALPRVVEPFYRELDSSSPPTPGVGLGLAIVRRVADLHRCTLDLQSTLGQGTTITVVWPPSGEGSSTAGAEDMRRPGAS